MYAQEDNKKSHLELTGWLSWSNYFYSNIFILKKG